VEVLTPEEQAEAEASTRKATIDRCLAGCGVEDHFREAMLHDARALPDDMKAHYLELSAQLETLRTPSRPGRFILIIGNPGLCKTHAVCALVMALAREGQYAQFLDTRSLMSFAHSAAVGATSERWETRLAALARRRLLVLDEVAAPLSIARSPFNQERLEEVINARYVANRDTIATTNATAERLAELLGDRVVSRAKQGGLIRVTGMDVRGRLLAVRT
jgi:DNA replication protein DnaC